MSVPPARFTSHAFDQVGERLFLPPEQIRRIIDEDLVVPIGVERKGYKVHLLFFSTKDGFAFVAVQDRRNGEIITILPLEYHNQWKISFSAVEWARDIAEGIKRRPVDLEGLDAIIARSGNLKRRFSQPPGKLRKRMYFDRDRVTRI